MTKTQAEVITSVQRRRRWSRSEKERIVAASLEPGAVASVVAREAGIHSSQLFRWRQQLCEVVRPAAGFAALTVTPAAVPSTAPGLVEIEFATGARVRVSGAADATIVTAVIDALMRGRR